VNFFTSKFMKIKWFLFLGLLQITSKSSLVHKA
jgi:hypothetical protein